MRSIAQLIRSQIICLFSLLLFLATASPSQAAESPALERMKFGYSAAQRAK
jgi:hypothetical protein